MREKLQDQRAEGERHILHEEEIVRHFCGELPEASLQRDRMAEQLQQCKAESLEKGVQIARPRSEVGMARQNIN